MAEIIHKNSIFQTFCLKDSLPVATTFSNHSLSMTPALLTLRFMLNMGSKLKRKKDIY